mmetsp:Transcript_1962/g.12400  ORF Transcript_1962/g.12400 Transcript_1962/m.12400 type:complete len:201 (-) Transcript_1962:5-607(-)
MAVLIVIVYAFHSFGDEFRHPIAHALGDVQDDIPVFFVQISKHSRDFRHFHHEFFVVSISTVLHGELFVSHIAMEFFQQGEFSCLWQGHVVFDGIQGPQHEVEHAHGISELLRKLLDDHCEAPGDSIEHAITERQARFLWETFGSICRPFGAHLRVFEVSIRTFDACLDPSVSTCRTRAIQSPGCASNCATVMATVAIAI